MKKIVLLLFCVCASAMLQAQSLNLLNSLSGMSPGGIDKLTEKQIGQIATEMENNKMSVDQMESQAQQYGLSKQSAARLKRRLVRYSSVQAEKKAKQDAERDLEEYLPEDEEQEIREPKEEEIYVLDKRTGKMVKKLQIFGLSTFRDANLTFEPNLRIATPEDYVLGPDDELLIDIYGTSEASYNLFVSPEGKINIPYVGVLTVGGLTINDAKGVIKKRLSSVYQGISSGTVDVSIALGDIRSITVSVIGEVASPGSYTIPSLSSVYNALYLCGGPTENASFRKVQISRGNRIIQVVDLYDFLVYGKSSTVRLQDQDVIKVLPYKNRVSISGEVKTPAIYEMNEFETVGDLIEFAGGFSQHAYRDRVTAYRNTPKERSVIDVAQADYDKFYTEVGDEYFVGKLIDRFANRVQIQGSVYRPGEYALDAGMHVSDLLKKADGLLDDAFSTRAIIFRRNVLNRPEMLSFSPEDVLSGKNDVSLQREDSVHVYSLKDMMEDQTIYVSGAVVEGGTFDFAEGMTLKDAILLAKGFTSKADLNEILLFRQNVDLEDIETDKQKAMSFRFSVDSKLGFSDSVSSFRLQKNDRITVRSLYGLEDMRRVSIVGEVKFPGDYVILSKSQRISDLIEMAGGLTEYAYPEGAFLIRKRNLSDAERRMMEEVNEQLEGKVGETDEDVNTDSLKQRRASIREWDLVGLDLKQILAEPGSKYDILLTEGDSISIPQQLETVFVEGEVLQPNAIRYEKGKSFSDYVQEAGGCSSKAWKKGMYVVHANGSVKGTRSFLGIRRYPKVLPGSRIVVPEKEQSDKMSTGEVVTLSSSIVSMAAIIVSLFK
ncbi:MAG: SLBB domain-containing protein [Bacteroidaceae bacterium]|jgi:protein involved in polysaccharide export with SLBB domain